MMQDDEETKDAFESVFGAKEVTEEQRQVAEFLKREGAKVKISRVGVTIENKLLYIGQLTDLGEHCHSTIVPFYKEQLEDATEVDVLRTMIEKREIPMVRGQLTKFFSSEDIDELTRLFAKQN
jgi:hypothetical protein